MTSFERIRDNLIRQKKGLDLLQSLLEEEFALLRENKTEDVVGLEFSIHELLRQLAAERVEIKSLMQDTRLAEYSAMLEPEEGEELQRLLEELDEVEQKTARQAGHNTRLSLALLDQSQELLGFLHEQVAPKDDSGYGAKGEMKTKRPGAALFSGRL